MTTLWRDITMPKLVYVCDYSFLEAKMDKNAFYRVRELLKHPDVVLEDVKRGDSVDAVALEKKHNPKMIMQEHIQPGFPLMLYNLDKVKCKTARLVGDLHSNDSLLKQMAPFDIIILYYDAGLSLKRFFKNKEFIVIPHHISFELYKNLYLEKEYDILLYGNTNSDFYPFRKRLHKLLEANFNCKKVEYPKVTGEALVKLLNRSWMSVATKSTEDYLVAKYIEIPACNCLPIGNIATTERAVFEDVMFELKEDWSDEYIIEVVKECLGNKERLATCIEWNHKRISSFSTVKWVEKIMEIVNDK